MKRIRVCYIGDGFPPYDGGGAEVQLYREVVGVAKRGHEVSVITNHGPPGSKVEGDGFPVHRLPLRGKWLGDGNADRMATLGWSLVSPPNMRRVRRILAAERPDVVHAQHMPTVSYSVLRAVDRTTTKIVQTFHGYQFECPKGGLLHRSSQEICTKPRLACEGYIAAFRRIVPTPDALIAPSTFMKERMVGAGYDPGIISVVWQGLDVEAAPSAAKGTDVVFLGRITHAKGLADLLDAARILRDEEITWSIVGAGPDAEYYRGQAADLPKVRFLGRIPNAEIGAIYSRAGLVVVPSRWHEILNTVICEAMAHGRPVVATDVGGNSDMLVDGETGRLVPPRDPARLASAVRQIVLDTDTREEMGRKALERSELFRLDRHVDAVLQVYQQVLSTPE